MHWGHVVALSGFYCGSVGCWVGVVEDMGMCWDDVGAVGSGVRDVICMWICWWYYSLAVR